MKLIHMICSEIKKQVRNRYFVLGVLGAAFLMILDTLSIALYDGYTDGAGKFHFENTVIGLLELADNTMFGLVALCACAMAAGCAHCDNEEYHMMHPILMRSSHKKYAVSTLVSCGITGFLCMGFAMLIKILVYACMVPIREGDVDAYELATPLLRDGHHYLYMGFWMALNGMKSAFFSMVSFTLSAFVKNKFVLVSIPVLVYYLLMRFGYGYLGPSFYIVNVRMVYFMMNHPTEGGSLLYTFIYTVIAGILFGIIFYKGIRRKY